MTTLFDKAPPTSLDNRLNNLDRQLSGLVAEVRRLRTENKQLVEDRRQLRATVDKQRDELKTVQNRVKSSIVVSTMAQGEGDASALRNRIDEYVKEIDKCIGHLSE